MECEVLGVELCDISEPSDWHILGFFCRLQLGLGRRTDGIEDHPGTQPRVMLLPKTSLLPIYIYAF